MLILTCEFCDVKNWDNSIICRVCYVVSLATLETWLKRERKAQCAGKCSGFSAWSTTSVSTADLGWIFINLAVSRISKFSKSDALHSLCLNFSECCVSLGQNQSVILRFGNSRKDATSAVCCWRILCELGLWPNPLRGENASKWNLHAVANGSVHSGWQRNCPQICVRASSVDWVSRLRLREAKPDWHQRQLSVVTITLHFCRICGSKSTSSRSRSRSWRKHSRFTPRD